MWKTSTIISILIVAICAVSGIFYFKNKQVKELESNINTEVENRLGIQLEKERKQLETEVAADLKLFKDSMAYFKDERDHAVAELDLALHGDESKQTRVKIKEESKEELLKIKIRKGEVYTHERTGFLLLIKPNYYEDRVVCVLTRPDEESEEFEMELGKMNYFWNYGKGHLSEIMMTFIGEKDIEVQWNSYLRKRNQ